MKTRYAIRIDSDSGSLYNMQGLPNVASGDGFEFAILYATEEHAKTAAKKLRGKWRTSACRIFIIPVQCEIGVGVEV